jgi:hypothetical protein
MILDMRDQEMALEKEARDDRRKAHKRYSIDNLAVSANTRLLTILNDSFLKICAAPTNARQWQSNQEAYLQNNDVREIGKYKRSST